MADLTVRELKTEMDGHFTELRAEMNGRFADVKTEMDSRFAAVDRRFDRLEARFEARLREENVETRRHFDVVAESLKAEMRLRLEGTDASLDNHERRIQALEKRQR